MSRKSKTTTTSGQALNNQLWSIQPINNGNSFAFISAGPTATVCAGGDGGILDKVACDGVFNTSMVAQPAQFFISCTACDAKGKGATNCQIQSAFEGQCALFFLRGSTLSSLTTFWDIVSEI
ncbi:hypothetical protein M422DRAFT_269055 [Sphaerobolus stellatus SS14]|uniref:Uncharacterized protein n=1 Tax=Sphaerobolus stellatus (strain SS14) TaxID=990650 RepID=A0A0C9UW15_SPHS4|nr:hypothetical protein M422DRAFT_269055 [Sphaerobolus stellatus SS14]